jgi:hypothetical protein
MPFANTDTQHFANLWRTSWVHEADEIPEGYARFNDGYHLCVDVPDGSSTISVRTSEGKQITFAFMPYSKDGAPQCVDIQHHHDGDHTMNGDTRCSHQDVRVFTPGGHVYSYSPSKPDGKQPATLTTVIFDGPPNTI